METTDDCTLGVTPFLTKTFEMVDDPATNNSVCWHGEESFIVKDPGVFSTQILPRYFKHNNLSSFVRQLNIYGFRKVASDCWEFAHPKFRKGRIDLLKEISRRKAVSTPKEPSVTALHSAMGMGILKPEAPLHLNSSLGAFGMQELLQDKMALIREVITLREQHDASQRMLAATLNELYQTRCEQQRSEETARRLLQYVNASMPTKDGEEEGDAPGPNGTLQDEKEKQQLCSIKEILERSQALDEGCRKRPREEDAATATDVPPLKNRCLPEDLANMTSRVDQYDGMPWSSSTPVGPWPMMPETSPGLMALSHATQLQATSAS